MRFKIMSLLLATAMLSACASKPKQEATTGGGQTEAPAATPVESAALTPEEELKSQVGDRVFFSFDKSDISSEARAVLERQAAFAQKYPSLTFTIEGHCDERGTREYNLALGERRATAAKNALVALGVQSSRLQTISYGKERPAVVGSNEAAYAQNRRAVTVVN
jgi:peptidoglycan-associated lipoprotein